MTAVQEQVELEPAELISRYQAGIWRYLRFLGADRTEADDLVQETFLAVLRGNFHQRSDSQTAAYLRKVARNQLFAARRRQGKEINTVEMSAAESIWVDVAAADGLEDYLLALRECLKHVNGRAEEAINLIYRQGRKRTDVAAQLEMKPEGIKTLLRRTRETLRDCVERKVRT